MEAALALGTLVLVTAAAVSAVAAVGAGVRCADAARELARQAARGATERGLAAVAVLAPAGADAELRTDGDAVVAVVRARPVPLLPVTVGATATAVLEPGAGVSGPVAPAGDTAPAPGSSAAPVADTPGAPTRGTPGRDRRRGSAAPRPARRAGGATVTGRAGALGLRRTGTAAPTGGRHPGRIGRTGFPPWLQHPQRHRPCRWRRQSAHAVGAGFRLAVGRRARTFVRDDRGIASVWAATAAAALLLTAAVCIDVGAAIRARQVAAAAADLSALAAAGRSVGGVEDACRAAAELAARNGAELTGCRLDGWDALVETRVARAGLLPTRGPATARARAGPAPLDGRGTTGRPR